jgi:hypothetical protein
MKDFYYYSFLLQNSKVDKEILDLIKYDLDKKVYSYGNQFRKSYENFSALKFFISLIVKILFSLKYAQRNAIKKGVVFNANFYLVPEFIKNGYNLVTPELYFGSKLGFIGSIKTLIKLESIKYYFIKRDMFYLLGKSFENKIISLKKDLKIYITNNDIRALFLSNDMAFLEKLFIVICKDLGIPSFVFLHGIPTTYNNIDNNRADYLVVWSDKIRNTYINMGVDKEKILVAGNPIYSSKLMKNIPFTLENILIITHSITQTPENSDKFVMQERGALLTYLYSIQKVLSVFGIKSVRLRTHPSENPNWYMKNIDSDFYVLDDKSVRNSIDDADIVIGPISTVFFDALSGYKNYIIYEPLVKDKSVKNFELVPPFDGSDSRIPLATSEAQLIALIENKKTVGTDVLSDYAGRVFDFDVINDLI